MKQISLLFILFATQLSISQQKITLEDCYLLANKNYPLAKQTELLQQKTGSQNCLDILGNFVCWNIINFIIRI